MSNIDEVEERYATEKYIVDHFEELRDMLNHTSIDNGLLSEFETSFLEALSLALATVYTFVGYVDKEYNKGSDKL